MLPGIPAALGYGGSRSPTAMHALARRSLRRPAAAPLRVFGVAPTALRCSSHSLCIRMYICCARQGYRRGGRRRKSVKEERNRNWDRKENFLCMCQRRKEKKKMGGRKKKGHQVRLHYCFFFLSFFFSFFSFSFRVIGLNPSAIQSFVSAVQQLHFLSFFLSFLPVLSFDSTIHLSRITYIARRVRERDVRRRRPQRRETTNTGRNTGQSNTHNKSADVCRLPACEVVTDSAPA